MADLASSLVKVNDVESAQLAPVSEATIQKIGSSVNGLIDAAAALTAIGVDVSTPVTLAFTSFSGFSGSYTTPNTKQIYAAVGIGNADYTGTYDIDDVGIVVLQGRSFSWYEVVGGSSDRHRTLSIGGTNNRTLTFTATLNAGDAYVMVIYEP